VTATNVNAKRLKMFKKKRTNINTACPSAYISVQQSYNKIIFAECAAFCSNTYIHIEKKKELNKVNTLKYSVFWAPFTK